jgi:hypothetical protein
MNEKPFLKDVHSCGPMNDVLRFRLDFSPNFIGTEAPSVYRTILDDPIYYLSAKQIPSACALRRTGSPSVNTEYEVLQETGFPLRVTEFHVVNGKKVILSTETHKASLLTEENLSRYYGSDTESEASEPASEVIPTEQEIEHIRRRFSKGIAYQDPWKILSYRAWRSLKGLKPKEVRVWFGDVRRIQDPISPGLLGANWKGSSSNRQRFEEISDLRVKLDFIRDHTFWGHALYMGSKGIVGNSESELTTSDASRKGSFQSWCTFQWKRLRRFLAGEADPNWPKSFRDKHFHPDTSGKRRKTRSLRLIEVLKTVDGMFCQRYIAIPYETWTWEKFDMFVLKNLFVLLSDEFLDGEISKETLDITTRYEELKASRGSFKYHSHIGSDLETLMQVELPEWLHQLYPLWREVMEEKRDYVRFAKIGLLSQTRGCGTPPSLVTLRTKRKFLQVVTEIPEPLSVLQKKAVISSVTGVIDDIPDYAFTGLETKSRITVTSAACWEYTQKEGGTVQAISDLVALGHSGKPAQVFDLDTGLRTGEVLLSEVHPGEYIFWRCLEYVLGNTWEEVSPIQMVAVKEPGKTRIVTKGSAYLKMVLDLVNKICSEPIKKGLESSQSGMAESNHGWNLFRSFFEGEKEKLIFEVETEKITPIHGTDNLHVERKFKPVYVSSTDFETATDYMNLEVARIVGTLWMQRCGIPKVLSSIVQQFCFRPRTIYFHATGCLSDMGVEHSKELKLRKVILSRGIMMGDPLTKVVLHLVNASVRYMSLSFDKVEFLRKIYPLTFQEKSEDIRRKIGNL